MRVMEDGMKKEMMMYEDGKANTRNFLQVYYIVNNVAI